MNKILQKKIFNQQLTVIKTMPWKNCGIYDLCWLSTLEKFIVLTVNKGLCLINENLTLTEEIQINPEQIWWRCTCSDTSLYLITSRYNTDIFEFDFLSSFRLIKRWKTLHVISLWICIIIIKRLVYLLKIKIECI
jgi:hypothetical protein